MINDERSKVLTKYGIEPDNLIKLNGPWNLGYAIALHSISSELIDSVRNIFDTKRTALGQSIFLYKYRQHYYLRDDFVNIAEIIIEKKFIEKIDILTIPPANIIRDFQPLENIARSISSRLGIQFYIIAQKESGQTMKNIKVKTEKLKYLMNNLYCSANNIEHKNILIVDDIFDSGATLETCTQKLKEQNCKNVYVLTFTKTR